jgi:limonene-1,2-epoxide hydrolase
MTTTYCKKLQKGKQMAVTRTLLTPETLTKNSTITCTQNQEHFIILLEQYR